MEMGEIAQRLKGNLAHSRVLGENANILIEKENLNPCSTPMHTGQLVVFMQYTKQSHLIESNHRI